VSSGVVCRSCCSRAAADRGGFPRLSGTCCIGQMSPGRATPAPANLHARLPATETAARAGMCQMTTVSL
jgi:hypothetical protein